MSSILEIIKNTVEELEDFLDHKKNELKIMHFSHIKSLVSDGRQFINILETPEESLKTFLPKNLTKKDFEKQAVTFNSETKVALQELKEILEGDIVYEK